MGAQQDLFSQAPPAVRVSHPHVIFEGGVAFVEGSRVPVRRIWEWHQRGVPIATLVKRYPQLGPARVLSALAFAYDNPERAVWDGGEG